jgi:hypothetical protein
MISRTDATRDVNRNLAAEEQQAHHTRAPNITIMANRGYDVVVDVDQEVRKRLRLLMRRINATREQH